MRRILLTLSALSLSSGLHAHPDDFTAIVESAAPAVVNIRSLTELAVPDDETHRRLPQFLDRWLPGRERDGPSAMIDSVSTGSGFIVGSEGFVITNRHVIAGAQEIRVRLSDRRDLPATVVGTDPDTDIALLKIDAHDLPVIEIGRSDELKVGEWVVAIGSPFNFDNTVTAGIVSAKNRSFQPQQYVRFLQTDVPINRGNSGGPLLNLRGEVVGINSQIFSEDGSFMGLSFSIPIEIAMAVVDQIRVTGFVSRGLLGVGIEDVTRDLADVLQLDIAAGAVVTYVLPDSAADMADIRPWDVITAVNDSPVTRYSDVPPLIGMITGGTTATISLRRGESELTKTVTIAAPPPADSPSSTLTEEADDQDPGDVGLLGLEMVESADGGLEVIAIHSPRAQRAGVQVGDFLFDVNGHPVPTLAAFRQAVDKSNSSPVALRLRRGISWTFATIRNQ